MIIAAASITSCNNDEETPITPNKGNTGTKETTKETVEDLYAVKLPKTRAFVMNEGSYDNNDATLMAFDYSNDTVCSTQLILKQNGQRIGDTGMGLTAYDGDLFFSVYGSSYIAKTDGYGLLKNIFKCDEKMGQPRNIAANDNNIYVTTYGGYVAKFDAESLTLIDTLKVDANPEQIIVSDGYIYCVSSGWGAGNTMTKINETRFTVESIYTIESNPQKIIADNNGNIYYTHFDASYNQNIYAFNESDTTSTYIGYGQNIVANGNTLYIIGSTYDENWMQTNIFYSYNSKTKSVNEQSFIDSEIEEEIKTANIYAFDRNPYNGDLYIATTDYKTSGIIYHFDSKGKLISKILTGGINPNKIVFLNE